MVLVEELLSRPLQRLLSNPVYTLHEVYQFLLERFGDTNKVVEGWLRELEDAAVTRHGGTRSRYEALVAVSQFIKRVTSLSP